LWHGRRGTRSCRPRSPRDGEPPAAKAAVHRRVRKAARSSAENSSGSSQAAKWPPLRHIVCGHQNKQLDDDAERTIAETRQYLDVADELMGTETTAVDFFNAMVERYPNHLARTVLWASASALYGVREHPGEDVGQILVAGWL
jgi:hypothetical protein